MPDLFTWQSLHWTPWGPQPVVPHEYAYGRCLSHRYWNRAASDRDFRWLLRNPGPCPITNLYQPYGG